MTQADSTTGAQGDGNPSPPARKRAWQGFSGLASMPHHLIIGAALFVLSLCFNLYRLGTPSIWFDEAFSVELARHPISQVWQIIFGPEPNMELYYLFLHYWLALTGFLGLNPTEFVVRLPSAIFAALSTVVVFALGRRFLGTVAGTIGAVLYLLNYLQLYYDLQTRAYGLQLLLTCFAWYALLIALTDERHPRRWWIVYVISTVLAVYAHLFSILIVCAQFCAVAGLLLLPGSWRTRARRQALPFGISLVVTGVLSIPMLLVSLHGAKTGWLPSPHFGDLINFIYNMGGYNKIYLLMLGGCCALGVIIILLARVPAVGRLQGPTGRPQGIAPTIPGRVLAFVYSRGDPLRSPAGAMVWTLLCWFVVPVVVSYIISQGATRLFSARYLVVVVPPLVLLAGLGIALLRWRALQVVLAVVMIASALAVVPFYYRSVQVEDWNTAVPWLQQHYQPGDGLVCYDNTVNGAVKQGCQISVEYYLHAYPSRAHFTTDAPGAFSWTTYSAPNPDAAVDQSALAAYAAKHPHLFLIAGRVRDDAAEHRLEAAQQWLTGRYHLVSEIVTPTVRIWLFDTTSAK